MSFSQLTKEEWTATADKESTLESAVVFEGESSKTCGHALHWAPLLEYLESCGSKRAVCPLCQAPIALVCDGAVATAISDDGNKNGNTKIVTVKFRNHVYKLSLQRASNFGLPIPLAYCVWMWQSILYLMGEETSVTAQERIAQALRLDMEGHMKVCRGPIRIL